MSYRRRDASQSYSSADAYRAVPATSPSFVTARVGAANSNTPSSSDEDAHLTSPVVSPQPGPIAQSFVRARAGSASRPRRRDSADERDIVDAPPLSPPRPQFFAGPDRSSWSSNDQEPASDSDVSSAANLAGRGSGRRMSVEGNPVNRVQMRSVTQPMLATRGPPRAASPRQRNHRRSSMATEYAYSAGIATEEELASPTSSINEHNPFGTPTDTPRNSLYGGQAPNLAAAANAALGPDKRVPPSAYSFPFQSHPGNPDPGLSVPGRRTSAESLRSRTAPPGVGAPLSPNATNATNNNPLTPPGSAMGTTYPVPANGQSYGLLNDVEELGRPFAPFMGDGSDRSQTPPSPNASQSQLYRGSAAGAMQYGDGAPGLPRTGSTAAMSMRAPFLSPASRPTSSLWAPPSVPYAYPPASGSSSGLNTYVGSGSALYAAGQYPSYQDIQAQLRKAKPVMPSSRLPEKLATEDKPWMQIKDGRSRASWWLTFIGMVAGVAGAAVLCYFSWTSVLLLSNSDLCQVFSEDWSNGYTNNWVADVELGGFGNGEFQMTTTDSKNIYTQNNELYIMPTLTSEDIGYGSVLDGYTYKLSGCTTTNATACSVTSSNKSYTVINPVQSARISTRGKASLKYGRVEVVAKIPTGDWLWPAIWMLPVNNTYGNWPMSGEIDLMEARGNSPAYPAQGTNYVRASLNYGVLPGVQTHLFGWWEDKRSAFSEQFHTYALEWTDGWMRLYVDSRLQAMMNIKITGKGGKSFYDQGNYPSTATNGSNTEVVVQDIWSEAGGGPNAPYDQEFYLILDVAAGGTSGWFPDNVGGKPWYDGSATAMREFALAQDTWSATWPSDADDRAFRVGSVKMWKLGAC